MKIITVFQYLTILLFVNITNLAGQTIISPRAEVIGGGVALQGDFLSIALNPAGMAGISGIKFGSALEIVRNENNQPYFIGTVIPLTEKLHAGVGWYDYLKESFGDYEILSTKNYKTYTISDSRNKLFLSSSYKISNNISLGVGAVLSGNKSRNDTLTYISETQLIDRYNFIFEQSAADLRFGIIYQPLPNLSFGLELDRLMVFDKKSIILNEDKKKSYDFRTIFDYKFSEVLSRFGISYSPHENILFNTEVTLNKTGDRSRYYQRGGVEIKVDNDLCLRFGTKYVDKLPKEIVHMPVAGFGWSIKGFTIDYFTYKGDVHQIGISYQSEVKDSYIEILSVDKVKQSIFPALSSIYAQSPMVVVRIRNKGKKLERAQASFYIKKIMDRRTFSEQFDIPPGESVWIPIHASFNKNLQKIEQIEVFDAHVEVEPFSRDFYKDRTSIRYVVQGKNDWDGDPANLKYYLSANDPEIVKYVRDVVNVKSENGAGSRIGSNSTNRNTEIFNKAQMIFDHLSRVVSYSQDPHQLAAGADRVQTPLETIDLKSGDCDDLTVLYSTLLNSIGINTAFVDVKDPESKNGTAHIYLLFDTEIPIEESGLISSNEKKYMVRQSSKGYKSVWIPVENTLVGSGFNNAWEYAANSFYNDAYIKMGLIKNWLKIVDVK